MNKINKKNLSKKLTNDEFNIISRVSDKNPNDKGHPIQYDGSQWFVHTSTSSNTIQSNLGSLDDNDITYFLRKDDDRSIDEKVYNRIIEVSKNT